MNYRRLGKTELMVSEIGLGGEWLEKHNTEECCAIIKRCEELGINILDCWMSEPNVRSNIGIGIHEHREKWIIQGQIGSTWQDGQYVRTRKLPQVKAAFQDLLTRMQTDYIDLGVIHYVDTEKEWKEVMETEFIDYVKELKAAGTVRHIGISTHNPIIAKRAALTGFIEMILFSINAAYDMFPPTDNLEDYFAEEYANGLCNTAPERTELYELCREQDVGITVMKGFAGGRLLDAARSPFGAALTPVQCIHYALTRPAVASVLVGFDEPHHVDEAVAYETATEEEKDYTAVLAGAPRHAYNAQCAYCGHCQPCPKLIDIAMVNKFYDLATMHEEVPASVKAHYLALPHTAGECVACHSCEKRCPFGVKIAQRMQKAAELFGK